VSKDLDQVDRPASSYSPAEGHPALSWSPGRAFRLRLVWWFAFLSFGCLASIWAIATPINGSPDEREHVVRAAAVARGQLVARNGAYVNGTGALVLAPASLSALMLPSSCFFFRPDRTADCARPGKATTTVSPQVSGAGRYFPLYYGIVGVPTLMLQNVQALYLMRLVSVLGNAILVASAVTSAAAWRRSPLLVTGLYAAVTPMILFLSGVVNPNSWEITAGLCLWTSSLALLFAEDRAEDSRLLARVGIAAIVLVCMRSLSPLWLALILLLVTSAALGGRLTEVMRWRATIAWAAAVAIATLVSVAWTVQVHVLEIGHLPVPAHLQLPDRIETSVLRVPGLAREMVGVFGWLDTSSPEVTYVFWAAGVGALVLLGMAGSAGLARAALVGAIVLTIVVPIATEVPGANTYGFAWQGRYTLPLAVGVPILGALAAAVGGSLAPQAGIRLTASLAVLLSLAHFFAFWWMLLRYQVGAGHSLNPLQGSWHPPGGSLLVLVAYGVGLLSWGVLASIAWRLAGSGPQPPDELLSLGASAVSRNPA
jgi:uncharacterized membrane protein